MSEFRRVAAGEYETGDGWEDQTRPRRLVDAPLLVLDELSALRTGKGNATI